MLLKLFSGVFSSDSSDDAGSDWLIWVKTAEIIAFSRVFDSAFATIADLSTYEEPCLTHKNTTVFVCEKKNTPFNSSRSHATAI